LSRDADTIVLLGFDEPLEADMKAAIGASAIGLVGRPRVILTGE
jgi:hypothetical protein